MRASLFALALLPLPALAQDCAAGRAALRYALALGAAGHAASDPVEARRRLQGLAIPGKERDAAVE